MGISLLLVFLGATIGALLEIQKAKKKLNFDWNTFWNQNAIGIILNYLIGICLTLAVFLFNKDFDIIADGYDITGLIFLVLGYVAHTVFNKLVKYGLKKTTNKLQ